MAKENSFFKMEMLILMLLKQQDYYAYELAGILKKKTNGIIDMSLGTLYPILYRLQNEGLITATDKLEKRRVKVYYHIEPEGLLLLNNLMQKYSQWTSAIQLLINEMEEDE